MRPKFVQQNQNWQKLYTTFTILRSAWDILTLLDSKCISGFYSRTLMTQISREHLNPSRYELFVFDEITFPDINDIVQWNKICVTEPKTTL